MDLTKPRPHPRQPPPPTPPIPPASVRLSPRQQQQRPPPIRTGPLGLPPWLAVVLAKWRPSWPTPMLLQRSASRTEAAAAVVANQRLCRTHPHPCPTQTHLAPLPRPANSSSRLWVRHRPPSRRSPSCWPSREPSTPSRASLRSVA